MANLLLILLFSVSAMADVKYLPRSMSEFNPYVDITKHENVFIPGSEIVWANYDLLRRDFPHLAGKSDQEIDAWLTQSFSYISRHQLDLNNIRSTQIFHHDLSDEGYRQPTQGRGDLMVAKDDNGQSVGLVDRKGTGVNQFKKEQNLQIFSEGFQTQRERNLFERKSGMNGLMTLGEAIMESTVMEATQALFDIENLEEGTNLQTIQGYFIMKLPFDVKRGDDLETTPAAIYGRQAHIGRAWVNKVHNHLASIKQVDISGSFVDGGTVKLKSRLLSETKGLVHFEEGVFEYSPFVRGSDLADRYALGEKDVAYRFLEQVLYPIRNIIKSKRKLTRLKTLEESIEETAKLILTDPIHYHRFSEIFMIMLESGRKELLDNQYVKEAIRSLLGLSFAEKDQEFGYSIKKFGIWLLPALSFEEARRYSEENKSDPEFMRSLRDVYWLFEDKEFSEIERLTAQAQDEYLLSQDFQDFRKSDSRYRTLNREPINKKMDSLEIRALVRNTIFPHYSKLKNRDKEDNCYGIAAKLISP